MATGTRGLVESVDAPSEHRRCSSSGGCGGPGWRVRPAAPSFGCSSQRLSWSADGRPASRGPRRVVAAGHVRGRPPPWERRPVLSNGGLGGVGAPVPCRRARPATSTCYRPLAPRSDRVTAVDAAVNLKTLLTDLADGSVFFALRASVERLSVRGRYCCRSYRWRGEVEDPVRLADLGYRFDALEVVAVMLSVGGEPAKLG